MPAAMPDKIRRRKYEETSRTPDIRKTKYACILEADESMRIRMEGTAHRYHEDHIAGKGMNSLSHYNLVHKFIAMLQAMNIIDAKAAVEKEWKKLEKLPAWLLTKVRNKNEVIVEGSNKGRKVHFASLMDLCHLKNLELESQFQKYKGRVALRGDIVKDDSGSYAVFTEQGSSVSQMTAAKVMVIVSRLPGCAGQAADAVSAYTPVKMGDAPSLLKIPSQYVKIFGYVFRNTNGPCHSPAWKTQSFLLSEICTVILWQDYYGKMISRKFCQHTVRKIPNWECSFVN